MKEYKVFSTTADIGLRFWGYDYPALYRNALLGLHDLVLGKPDPVTKGIDGITERYQYEFTGDSCENVIVNVLEEYLYILNTKDKKMIVLEILKADKNYIDLLFFIVPLTSKLLREIKSVTYHNLSVKELDNKLIAEVVFDV